MNSPLIMKIVEHEDKETAQKLVQHIYDLSLLAQNELDSEKVSNLISMSTEVLSKLVS